MRVYEVTDMRREGMDHALTSLSALLGMLAFESAIYRLLALKAGILALQSKNQWCTEALTLLKGIKK